jgi:restriction system protein
LEELAWHQQLHQVLLALDPSAFERLAQRLLRESGFIQVQVMGKSGDGGIDGVGIARINGFLSFHVLFQCKRYQGSITAGQIRDFRGAMQGRTDKGLFITTGTFTRDAIKEATRDGAPPIDLIDGEQLVQRLKELSLGVKITTIESVEIDENWFAKI